MQGVPESHNGWTFLTSHARVLAVIAENHSARIRDIAAHCRLTERAVQKIIADLEQDGYLSHTREGRGNTYRIEPGKVLRHPAEAGLSVASLLSLLVQDETGRAHRSESEAHGPGTSRPGPPLDGPVARDEGHEYVSDI